MRTVEDIILEHGVVDDNTEIIIRNEDNFKLLAVGHWYDDEVLTFEGRKVTSYSWQDDNKVFIDVAEEELSQEDKIERAFQEMMDAWDTVEMAVDDLSKDLNGTHREFVKKMEIFEKVAGVTEWEAQRRLEEELERRKER